MSDTGQARPIAAGERVGALDALRGVAVCGILLMNITLMGLPEDVGRPPFPAHTSLDWIAYSVQSLLFSGSMRGLFTLLFGAGMMVMLRQAPRETDSPQAQAYLTRCFGLMLLGVAQFAIFLWPGENLFNYGVCGLALLLFRRAEIRLLLAAAAALLITISIASGAQMFRDTMPLREAASASAAQAAGKTLTPDQKKALEARAVVLKHLDPPKAEIDKEVARRTSFPGVLAWSTEVWINYNLKPEALIWGLESLGFMLIGVALYRLGWLTGEKSVGFYAMVAVGGYGLGMLIRGARLHEQWRWAFQPNADVATWSAYLYQAGRLPVTLGLLGLTMALYKLGALKAVAGALRAIGRLALTNYIGQSIITSVLFYGLGYLNKLGFAALMGVCVLVWIAQGIFSVLWLRAFEMGPFEWLLRVLTYGRWRPLKRA